VNLIILKSIFSLKKEIIIVSLAFLFVLLTPIITIITITQTGIEAVSNKLATQNTKTNTIEIHDPKNGNVIKTLSLITHWPTTGVVTLEFGETDLPYQLLHTGIDIANPNGIVGDPITPFMKGKVIYAGEINWGYGKHIIIEHENNITSIYAHLNQIYVKAGDEITSTEQIIGTEGKTGWSTGPHLHFQINVYGIPVNPRTFIQDNP